MAGRKAGKVKILVPVKWTPIDKTSFGPLPINPLATTTVTIPSAIPLSAREILFYVYIETNGSNEDANEEFRIYTVEGAIEYSHYLQVRGYNQAAWSYNSITFWLPITSAREIKMTSTGIPLTGTTGSQTNAIGYR